MSGIAAPPLDIVLGRADDVRAEVVVIVADAAGDAGPPLAGTLAGPSRRRDITLPVTALLVPLREAPSGARAGRFLVTEPAYWTPALPNLYRLQLSPGGAAGAAATIDRGVGLRRLGVRGRSLWLEGRRWVPRAVAVSGGAFEPESLRRLAAAAEIEDPAPAVCAAADTAGVAIVARLPAAATAAQIGARLAEWKLHPSVVLAVLPRGLPVAVALAAAADAACKKGMMLVALEVDGRAAPPAADTLARRVDCLVVDLPAGGLPHGEYRDWPAAVPLLARRGSAAGSPEAARQACDRLQADLAAWGQAGPAAVPPRDWAGYLVS